MIQDDFPQNCQNCLQNMHLQISEREEFGSVESDVKIRNQEVSGLPALVQVYRNSAYGMRTHIHRNEILTEKLVSVS